ncbi:hypothetical protein BS47DRAFT_1366745 [Hydnum rufescens UP504]|uniref:Uncharacterized protein n=1 Tax=Hydnum rufescens UP504 TaxID=1448309 RepID=A0A9P6AL03_9AGAM|nr:hypothetical protein BS47DRAFT_1366745 [Hydnum rufescens UP504]
MNFYMNFMEKSYGQCWNTNILILGLSSKELSTLYKLEKAQVTKKGKECLEEWFRQNLHKLEEIEGASLWNSMSASSHSKMMAKNCTDMSEKSRVILQNFQYELFGFIMNREVLDGQATANAYIFSSSKATTRILDKHIWSNMELRKKLQLDLMYANFHSSLFMADNHMAAETSKRPLGMMTSPPRLRCGKNIARHLPPTSKTQQAGLNEVRAAVSTKMMHRLRSVLNNRAPKSNCLGASHGTTSANFIYMNHPSFYNTQLAIHCAVLMGRRDELKTGAASLTEPHSLDSSMKKRTPMRGSSSLILAFNEDCKSPDFRNVMLISDEKGHQLCESVTARNGKVTRPPKPSVMRKGALDLVGAGGRDVGGMSGAHCARWDLWAKQRFLFPEVNRLSHDNDHVDDSEDDDRPQKVCAAKAHSATKVRTSTKVRIATKVPLNKMKDARSTKSRYRSASEDRANDSSDDDKYDNGNDSEAQPIHSKRGSIKEHVSRRNSDRRASKIKGKELKGKGGITRKGGYYQEGRGVLPEGGGYYQEGGETGGGRRRGAQKEGGDRGRGGDQRREGGVTSRGGDITRRGVYQKEGVLPGRGAVTNKGRVPAGGGEVLPGREAGVLAIGGGYYQEGKGGVTQEGGVVLPGSGRGCTNKGTGLYSA